MDSLVALKEWRLIFEEASDSSSKRRPASRFLALTLNPRSGFRFSSDCEGVVRAKDSGIYGPVIVLATLRE